MLVDCVDKPEMSEEDPSNSELLSYSSFPSRSRQSLHPRLTVFLLKNVPRALKEQVLHYCNVMLELNRISRAWQ